ncbi:MAG: hypothetical protein OHK0022_33790 [Roseiflexaceae bacterium]
MSLHSTSNLSADTAALLSAIIESPRDIVIFALDRDYRYLAFNTNHQRTIRHIWGVDIQIGMCMADIIGRAGDRAKAVENFDRALAGEAFTLVEEYGEDPNRFWYENTYNPMVNAAGEVIGLAVFLTDITARMRTEAELRQHQERLEELVRLRTQELEQANQQLQCEIAERQRAENERLSLQQAIIQSQEAQLRELSTPLIPVADGVVVMPLIGRIDDSRAMRIMESLLDGVARLHSHTAVIDISGVQVVDTRVADALLRSARAAQLLGTRVILTGISAEVAQTVVHLGTDMSGIVTRATLQHGLRSALEEQGVVGRSDRR